MVEHAELIAQMWQDNLGLDVTVEAGQNVSIRERVRNRELDGHVYFRSNEGRWDGGSLVRSMHYLDSSLRQSEDPELVKVADEGLSVMDPALRQDAYNKDVPGILGGTLFLQHHLHQPALRPEQSHRRLPAVAPGPVPHGSVDGDPQIAGPPTLQAAISMLSETWDDPGCVLAHPWPTTGGQPLGATSTVDIIDDVR